MSTGGWLDHDSHAPCILGGYTTPPKTYIYLSPTTLQGIDPLTVALAKTLLVHTVERERVMCIVSKAISAHT